MAKAQEICEVRCKGERFRDWTTVSIQREFGSDAAEFRMTVAEVSKSRDGWSSQKLKPGDEVEIWLAGKQAVRGHVAVRQASIAAQGHAVMVQGTSRTADLVRSSMTASGGQFKGYNFKQIANSVCQKHGFSYKEGKLPDGADRPFRDPQVMYGESCHEFLERLARQRGIVMSDDEQGNLVGGILERDGQSESLTEGENIHSIVGVFRDDMVPSSLGVIGQQKGSDDVFGKKASQVRAQSDNPDATRYRPLILVAEEPSDAKDLQQRADRELAERIAKSVDVSVTVYGWLRGNGALWMPGIWVKLKSPSVVPNQSGEILLRVRGTTFTQTAEQSGTMTTLDLCLDTGLSSATGRLPGGGAEAIVGKPAVAKPVQPDEQPVWT